eukprot:749354-Hanusia_phi.AAC.1
MQVPRRPGDEEEADVTEDKFNTDDGLRFQCEEGLQQAGCIAVFVAIFSVIVLPLLVGSKVVLVFLHTNQPAIYRPGGRTQTLAKSGRKCGGCCLSTTMSRSS